MKIFPPCGFSFNTILLNLELYWITGRIPLLLVSRILVVCGQCSAEFSSSCLGALSPTFYTVSYQVLIHTCFLRLSLLASKPLEIFGVMHRFQYKAIREGCKKQYPQLTSEQQSPETKGLVAFIRDHVVDLRFLNERPVANQATNPSQKGAKDEESGSKDEDGVRVDVTVVPS
jgi:hypothetical protein